MRHEPVRRAFRLDLFGGLAESQRLGLREHIGHQQVVMPAKRIQGLGKGDEIAGDEPRPLMDQLIEGMLAVGARLAPVDRAGVVVDACAVERDVLAVALHGELLQVGGKALEILLVGQHGDGLGAEEIVVPDREQTHQHRQVALERRGAEMLVHLVKAAEHGAEIVRADGHHGREADRRIHRIASADPIPEAEHVGGIDAELRHLLGVRRDGHKMLGDGAFVAVAGRPAASRARCGRWSWFRAW